MKPNLIFTLYKLDRLNSESLPEIAISLINQGIENEYLIEIAGLNKPTNREISDIINKAFQPYIGDKYDNLTMALNIAKAIEEGEIEPQEGAYLIGEISEELNRQKDLWEFKCLSIQYDDFEQDKKAERLGYSKEDLIIWKNVIIEDIKRDARLLVKKHNK